MYGYKDRADYYHDISVSRWVDQISVPLFGLHGKDDPVCGHQFIPFDKITAKGSKVIVGTTNYGGHACHVAGTIFPNCWYHKPCMEFINFIEAKKKADLREQQAS